MEEFHDLIAIDDRLEQTFVVFLLQVGKFFADHTEILEEHLLTHLVLRGDVRLAESHQIVDIVARIVKQTTYSTIRHLLVGNGYRTHVKLHKLLHIFHLHIQGQGEPTEDLRHHLGTYIIMVMEGPADGRIPTFRLCLADIVHDGTPTEP